MSIAFTGGGTGGHLAIIKAVKDEIKNEPMIYIGSNKGQDRAWFDSDSEFKKRYFLDMQGVLNQNILGKIKSFFMLAKATMEARKILKENDVKVVFCVGGFSAAPTSFAGFSLGIPLVIHEQNAKVGSLNKLLRNRADAFISSYEDSHNIRAYPIKKIFFDKSRIRDKVKKVIFLGGSQGAKAINELAIKLAPTLKAKNISIIHQAGEKHIDTVKKAYDELGIEAEVFGFTKDMVTLMNSADLAIARAGASTLWELSANSLPAVFVPYPYATGDHQYYNAKFLVDENVAWLMREESLEVEKIISILDEDLSQKSKKLQTLISSDGASQIAKLLKSY